MYVFPQQDKEPRGIIPLENLSIREVEDPRKPVGFRTLAEFIITTTSTPRSLTRLFHPLPSKNCFELYIPNNRGQLIKACKTEADGRVVEGNHMVYRISAPTPEEKDEWIHSIKCVQKKNHPSDVCHLALRSHYSLPVSWYIFTPLSCLSVCLSVSRPGLLSASTPSTKCWPPGRSVYHWRRRRSSRRSVFSSSPHLPSLPLSRLLPNLDMFSVLAPNLLILNFRSFLFFFFFLICFLRLLKVTFSEGLWPPLPLLLDLESQPVRLQSNNTVRPHFLSAHHLCLSTESD